MRRVPTGEQFALTYAVLLAVLFWQWVSVYRTDAPEYRPGARRYLAGMAAAIGAMLVSSGMDDTARLAVWAAVVAGSIGIVVVYLLRFPDDLLGICATDSMVERYGLFIIIVLGEVVLGVVDGMLAFPDLDFRTVATGVWASVSHSAFGGRSSITLDAECRGKTEARSRCGSTASFRSPLRWLRWVPAW